MGVCGLTLPHLPAHLSWPLGCRQHLGFPVGNHFLVIPSRPVPGRTCEPSLMNQVLLLPVSRDWSRGDPTQSSETQLWDFGGKY